MHLRCRRHVSFENSRGFQRYDLLKQDDEDDSPMVTSINERKIIRNTHAQASESEDGEEEIFSTSNVDQRPLLS